MTALHRLAGATEIATAFGAGLLAGLLCLFFVLLLLFEDAQQPVSMLSAILRTLGGAFVAMPVALSTLDVPSMIGLAVLMAIAASNAIHLVEHAVAGMREHGLSRFDALVEASDACAEPAALTTMAWVGGMGVVTLALGRDASLRQPLMAAVIAGLAAASLLGLLVVPVAFRCLDATARWLKSR